MSPSKLDTETDSRANADRQLSGLGQHGRAAIAVAHCCRRRESRFRRLRRERQRADARRAFEREPVLQSRPCAQRHRRMEAGLRYRETAFLARISPTTFAGTLSAIGSDASHNVGRGDHTISQTPLTKKEGKNQGSILATCLRSARNCRVRAVHLRRPS